jgi:hypothetical protein
MFNTSRVPAAYANSAIFSGEMIIFLVSVIRLLY